MPDNFVMTLAMSFLAREVDVRIASENKTLGWYRLGRFLCVSGGQGGRECATHVVKLGGPRGAYGGIGGMDRGREVDEQEGGVGWQTVFF